MTGAGSEMREFRFEPAAATMFVLDVPARGPGWAGGTAGARASGSASAPVGRAAGVSPGGQLVPVVFVHGLGSASTVAFRPAAVEPALVGRRLLLVDLLGFGHSERPERWGYTLDEHADSVAALLDAAGLRSVCLVGHSMGGAVAILLAARRPELVASLLVAEPNLDSRGGTPSTLIAAQVEDEFVASGWADLIRMFEADPASVSYARTLALSSPVALHRSARGLVAPRSPSIGEILGGLALPRRLLVGERSLPYPGVEALAAAGVKVVTLPGVGHNMSLEDPGRFASEVAVAAAQADSVRVPEGPRA